MGRILPILLIIVAAAILVLFNSFYIVKVDQQAILLQLGQQKATINAPLKVVDSETGEAVYDNLSEDSGAGLHFKFPFIQNVVYLDKKNIGFDLVPLEITASDKERLIVDAFVRWKIIDPLTFYRSAFNEIGATSRLDSITRAALREVLGDLPTEEIISGQRAESMTAIQTILNRGAESYGIEIVDVRILKADLPQEIEQGVFRRMQTERVQVATQTRAEGQEEALRIRAEADRNATVIIAQANETAQKIKGDGDAQRNAIYASAYNLDPDFFSFYRSMNAYEAGVQAGTPIILSPDAEFYRFFRSQDGN